MLALFRRNVFLTQLLLLPYVFLIRLSCLLSPKAFMLPEKSNIFQKAIYLTISHPLAQNVLANLLVFIQALLINHIIVKYRLSKENHLTPALAYIVLVSLIPQNLCLSPVLVANTFVLMALYSVFSTYKVNDTTVNMFNTGFLLALASLYYAPFFLFLLWGVIAFIQLRKFRLIEFFQYISGFGTPFFLLFTYRYWNDIPFIDISFLTGIFGHIPVFNAFPVFRELAGISLLLLCVALLLVSYSGVVGRKNIQQQKKFDILYWVLLFCFLSFLSFQSSYLEHMLTLALPLSFLGGVYAGDSKARLGFEMVHLVFLSVVIASQFLLI